MGYPTEQRFKILQQQYQDSQQIVAPAPNVKPQGIPCLVVDYITRSDVGYALKVIPLTPISVTAAGEITFVDGSNPIPATVGKLYYIPVYPIDTAPADVKGAYQIGQPIMAFPYNGTGPHRETVRGTYICISGGSLPTGTLQFQCYTMVDDNNAAWDYPRAHPIVGDD